MFIEVTFNESKNQNSVIDMMEYSFDIERNITISYIHTNVSNKISSSYENRNFIIYFEK